MPEWNWTALRNQSVIFEDQSILVLNKPANISVVGGRQEADIVRLASAAAEQLYPVHRIDKVTTGLVLFAKTIDVHGRLTRQFNKRTVTKRYLIITKTAGLPPAGLIDLPLATAGKGTVRIAALRDNIRWDEQTKRWRVAAGDVLPGRKAYPSSTRFATLWNSPDSSLVLAEPVTGRKHQLRVQFAWIGHPIFGDPLFDKTKLMTGWQTCLHSWQLEFDADWRSEKRMRLEAPPPDEFWRPVAARLPAPQRAKILERARAYQFDLSAADNSQGILHE